MATSLMWGRVLLAFIAVYHLCVGIILLWSGDLAIRIAKGAAGWTIQGTPALGIVGEILGCYIIAFALMMAAGALDPVGRRHLLTIGLVLIGLRLAQWLVFSDKVIATFQVPPSRYWLSFLIVLTMGVLLLVFRIQVARAAPR